MAEGTTMHAEIYVPADPMDSSDSVIITLTSLQGRRTRTFTDPTKSRDQLVTLALTALKAYLLNQ